jgi:hypothetical protein
MAAAAIDGERLGGRPFPGRGRDGVGLGGVVECCRALGGRGSGAGRRGGAGQGGGRRGRGKGAAGGGLKKALTGGPHLSAARE